MVIGAWTSPQAIITAMRDPKLKLENVNGPFGMFPQRQDSSSRKHCDVCTLIGPLVLANLGVRCVQVEFNNSNNTRIVCEVCQLFGRPCCSWTDSPAIAGPEKFTPAYISGSVSGTEELTKITADDVAHNKILRAALIAQPEWVDTGADQSFHNQLVRIDANLTGVEELGHGEEEF
ncbi:hypothetical protein BDV95DRAFT_563680 [Massariosphaeria phaeospora]|uniref:Uncharacterized protein n=1 Tax=Massariosphaeria phaeospora TaxID=100035 RepID=A0A7C8IE50_9PLEO|nr:hypothetical protein BDV95DRAFT_563680 [Massariosphaeria phaeospora]